jgi:archaellum biogenesis ATPase FlaH
MNEKDLTEKLENFAAVLGMEKIENPRDDKDILSLLESWELIKSQEVNIEYVIDRAFPKGCIIVIFGKGGIGKTWLLMDAARCIGGGIPWLGLNTEQTTVIFIDFENPLAVLITRTQKLGDAENVLFWRANNPNIKAPKLDKPDWELYKQLPQGAVLIFDTLRASQGRDENKSDDMAQIMDRLKQLRDMGFTVILLHHTAKNSDRIAKGSTAIVDLADHIIGLTLVKKRLDGQDVVVDDDNMDEDLLYRFGTKDKTRFEPFQMYLTLNPDRGFELAPDPEEDNLKAMHRILELSGAVKKTDFMKACGDRLRLAAHKARKLFDIGHGRYWHVEKQDTKNTLIVRPIQLFSFSTPIGSENLKNRNPVIQGSEKTGTGNDAQVIDNGQLFSFSKGFYKTEKQAAIDRVGFAATE